MQGNSFAQQALFYSLRKIVSNSWTFIGKLACLIPPQILNLNRFFGVFTPNNDLRARVTGLLDLKERQGLSL